MGSSEPATRTYVHIHPTQGFPVTTSGLWRPSSFTSVCAMKDRAQAPRIAHREPSKSKNGAEKEGEKVSVAQVGLELAILLSQPPQ